VFVTQDINPTWYRALTLAERAGTADHAMSGFDATEAQRRLQEWRLQLPFEGQNIFAERLAQDSLLEETLLSLLGESPEALAARQKETPPWLTTLLSSLDDPTLWETILWPEAAAEIPNLGFLAAATPMINHARRRLRAGIDTLQKQTEALPFDPETVEVLLLPDLARRLAPMLSRTMVLELHVARMQGFLNGNTGEERFTSFVQRLQQPEVAISLWGEYPVLARQVMVGVDQWASASFDFLQHLCSDWQAIRSTFFSSIDQGLLVSAEVGAGDRHRDGRSVIIVTFSHGDKLVYKPHSLAVDLAFQALVSQLNTWGAKPAFRALRILERDDYGWVEFVKAAPCSTKRSLSHFYKRMGGYLALLYALEAGDFHHENLIAAGEHPVLIDLEALFQPQVEIGESVDPATDLLNDSVMRIGLLPERTWGAGKNVGIDISGLGGAPGQLTPFKLGRWEESGNDSMYLVRRQIPLGATENQPTLKGEAVDPTDYADALVAGFTHLYHLLLRHRDELLAPSGPLSSFAKVEVRVILRSTHQYGLLLNESFHPDLLRDALDRDRLFDKLWIGAADAPYLQRALPIERVAMQRGDIPHFVTRPDSQDLWADNGICLPDLLGEAGMARVRHRLTRMTEADLQQQLGFIRAALTTLGKTELSKTARTSLHAAHEPASRDQLRAMAHMLGDRLVEQAVLVGDEAGWLGFSQAADGQLTFSPLGLDLYDGLPGVALYLAYLGKVTGDENYRALAQATLRTIQHRLADAPNQITGIGAFEDRSGLIYTFTHLGVLWSDPALLTQAQAMAGSLANRIVEDRSFDIMSGAAGCIGALLALHQVTGDATTLALAIRCGDHLLQYAQPQEIGVAWFTLEDLEKPLTGFAHGAAGIAWACGQLAAATGEERFLPTMQAALAYERSLFDEELGNWPDLRPYTPTASVIAWCHGAAGIGLSRLSQPDTVARAEVEIAVRTTLDGGLGGNHSLCHGDLGNLDFLQAAAGFLQDQDLSMLVARLASGLIADIERRGPLCGLPLQAETPALMTGLAGIGYGLLRLADPEVVPCLLLLAPPNLPV
jgi:type 2 lantibiotic biosynthesis protein LanM